MKIKNLFKILLLVGIIVAIVVAIKSGIGDYFSLEYVKENQIKFNQYYQENPLGTIGVFFAIYVVSTALSLPGAAILTIFSGALFGLVNGVIIASFASSIGATLAFLVSRFILRDAIESKFGETLKKVNKQIELNGIKYLLTIRLMPVFPFFVVNLVLGLTKIRLIYFYWVSQVGMFLATAVYVNAGLQLSKINQLSDLASFPLFASFMILGLFPLLMGKIVKYFQNRRLYSKFKKPKKFDYNMVVIGAGSAGLVSAYIAAAVKAKVLLIEKNKMGGDCLNTGCVPSKALIRSAKTVKEMEKAESLGIEQVKYKVNFKKVMAGIGKVIKEVEPHDSVERYESLGVECAIDEATIIDPWTVQVGKGEKSRVVKTKNIIVSTGARPFHVPLENIEKIKYLNSDNVWSLKTLPQKLVVLGGGPIGCELTQAFSTLGSNVTQVEKSERIMKVEDVEVSEFVTKKFEDQGIKVLVNHTASKIIIGTGKEKGKKYLVAEHGGKEVKIQFDELLVAVGRKANVTGFGLEELGVQLRPNGTVETNEYLETNYSNILACGDVTGPFQFTHTASHQAWYVAVNSLFGKFKKFKVDYRVIPWCTFTQPEVASVGTNEQTAKRDGVEYDLTTYDLGELDRAIADRATEGFLRVLTKKGTDKVIGATIVGDNASTLILEFITAMKNGLGLNKILGTIHIYPSFGEANKGLAGNWKKKNAPEKLLKFIEKMHRRALR